jgi:hypothetical protein
MAIRASGTEAASSRVRRGRLKFDRQSAAPREHDPDRSILEEPPPSLTCRACFVVPPVCAKVWKVQTKLAVDLQNFALAKPL